MKTIISILIFCIIALSILFHFDDYRTKHARVCVVVDKVQTSGGYKREGSFYIVYQIIDSQQIFDQSVSPSIYCTTTIGSTQIVDIAEKDIQQTPIKNILFFFLPAILLSVITVLSAALLIWGVSEK